jgi:hypothetical protein
MPNLDEVYLTVSELSDRIRYSQQSIYNMISEGIFVLNTHYLKPTPKKILFKWSSVQKWIEEPKITSSRNSFGDFSDGSDYRPDPPAVTTQHNRINI